MAAPTIDWTAHVRENRMEDVVFLRSHGASLSAVAARLGMTVDAVEKMLERAKEER